MISILNDFEDYFLIKVMVLSKVFLKINIFHKSYKIILGNLYKDNI